MIVVVTGSSSGIGLATCLKFASKNHIVYGISLDDCKNTNFTNFKCDITNYEEISKIIKKIYEKEKRIDVLINCAGFGISGAVEDTKIESIKKMYDVNFFSAINIINQVIPYMRNNKFGIIANISSVASILPIPFQTFYSANKASINLFSEALNIELKDFNIKIINFLPGDVNTGFTNNRVKNINNNPNYHNRIEKSVKVMEKDEKNGMTKEYVAKIIYKNINKKNVPLFKVIGKKYKIFVLISRFLPRKFINYIMGKIYGF